MSVGQYCLTSLDEIRAYIGNAPQEDGLWIYSSQADATEAKVKVTDSTLVLTITGGAEAGTDTLTFDDSDKNTLSELVVAIQALTGWEAGAIYHGSADSDDLIATGELSCLGEENQQTLKIEANYVLERIADRATDAIERYCGRKLLSRTYTRETYTGNGHTRLILRNYPVTRITRLSVGRDNAFYVKCSATTYAFIEVNTTQVILNNDGTSTTLTLSSYATINLLIAAINGTSGWAATLVSSDYGSYKASEVLPMPAQACKSPNIAYVEIPDDDLSGYYVENIADEFYNSGIIYYSGGFTAGIDHFITYLAGYMSIPYALEEACLCLVKYKYDKLKRDASVSGETVGGSSYTLKDLKEAMPENILRELDKFKRIIL